MKKGLIILLTFIALLPLEAFAQSNTLSIPLYDSHLSFDILKDVQNLQYAPDYNANITITPSSYQVIRNDNVVFKISIRDTGTIPMKTPYYYVFLVDNDGSVVSTFPDSSNLNQNSYSEFTPWQVNSPCTGFPPSDLGKTTDTIPQEINGTFWYISRDALLSSNGWMYYMTNYCYDSIENVIFTGKTSDDLGTWKIYVIVFDAQQYCTRQADGSLSCNGYGDYRQRKVAQSYNVFQVSAQSNTGSGGSTSSTTETSIITKILNNPWVITVGGGIIVIIVGYILFDRNNKKKLSSRNKSINKKQEQKENKGAALQAGRDIIINSKPTKSKRILDDNND